MNQLYSTVEIIEACDDILNGSQENSKIEGIIIKKKNKLNKKLMVRSNSDEPAYFGGYINKNLIECQIALDLSMEEVKTLIINSFKSSFLKEEKKKEWIEKL